MQKNPNFEWKPVSTGNEKFMIVLSWLVVAFVVVIVGLYYGKTNRTVDYNMAADSEILRSDSAVPVGEGHLLTSDNTSRVLSRKVLGSSEIYTIMLGAGNRDFSHSEAELELKNLIKRGYPAKMTQTDQRKQRYQIYVGHFENYNLALKEMDNLKGEGVPAGLTIISRAAMGTFRDKVEDARPASDPIRKIISNQRGEVVDNTAKQAASQAGESNNTIAAQVESGTTAKISDIVRKMSSGSSQNTVKPVAMTTLATTGSTIATTVAKIGGTTTAATDDDDLDLSLTDSEKARVNSQNNHAVTTSGNYKVQLAAFGTLKYALNYKNKLEKDGFSPVNIKQSTNSKTGKTFYLVRIEGFDNHDSAKTFVENTFHKYDAKTKPMILK